MKRKRTVAISWALVLLWGLVPVSLAQRGMGDASGVVRQGLKPASVTLQGTVARVIIGPCEKGTGQSDIGTHIILRTEQGQEQNIHLGPAHLVQGVTDLVSDGGAVTVHAFRTEKMPQGHYNAITVVLDTQTIHLRDRNLRPVWAGQTPLNANRSDMNWQNGREQRAVNLPRRFESHQYPGPRPLCRMVYSWVVMGRGRGWGRRWCCQGGPSRFGRQRRAWR
jgi:hypothetical protein